MKKHAQNIIRVFKSPCLLSPKTKKKIKLQMQSWKNFNIGPKTHLIAQGRTQDQRHNFS